MWVIFVNNFITKKVKQGKPEFVGGWQYAGELPGQHRWPNIQTIVSAADLWTYILKEFLAPDPLLNPTTLYADSRSLVEQLLIPFDQLGEGISIVNEYPYRTLTVKSLGPGSIDLGPGIDWEPDPDTGEPMLSIETGPGLMFAPVGEDKSVLMVDAGPGLAFSYDEDTGRMPLIVNLGGGFTYTPIEDTDYSTIDLNLGPGLMLGQDPETEEVVVMAKVDGETVGFNNEGELISAGGGQGVVVSPVGGLGYLDLGLSIIYDRGLKIAVHTQDGAQIGVLEALPDNDSITFNDDGELQVPVNWLERIISTISFIKNLYDSVQTFFKKIEEVFSQMGQIEEQVENAVDELTKLGTDVADMGTQVADMGTELANFGGDLLDMGSTVANMGATVANMGTTVAGLAATSAEMTAGFSAMAAAAGLSGAAAGFSLLANMGGFFSKFFSGGSSDDDPYHWDEDKMESLFGRLEYLYNEEDWEDDDDRTGAFFNLQANVGALGVFAQQLKGRIDGIDTEIIAIWAAINALSPVDVAQLVTDVAQLTARVGDLELLVYDVFQFVLNNRRHIDNLGRICRYTINKVKDLGTEITTINEEIEEIKEELASLIPDNLVDLVDDVYQMALNNRRHIENNARVLRKEIVKRDKQIEALMTAVSALAAKTGTDMGDIPDLVQYGLI